MVKSSLCNTSALPLSPSFFLHSAVILVTTVLLTAQSVWKSQSWRATRSSSACMAAKSSSKPAGTKQSIFYSSSYYYYYPKTLVFEKKNVLCIWDSHVTQISVTGYLDIYSFALCSYRKIPGDRCEAGIQPERKLTDLSKKCVSNLLHPELLVRDPYS